MSFTTGQYSINDVSVIIGDWTVQALAGEQPAKVERTNPEDWKKKVGSKGQVTFVYQPDKSGIFRIKVKQNSIDDNKQFHTYKEAGSIIPCTLVNNVTKEKAFGQFCMIGTVARIEFNSADEAELEYEVIVAEIVETRGK